MTVVARPPINTTVTVEDAPNAAPYADYRAICDDTDSVRRIGVMDPDAYEQALRDDTTMFCAIGGMVVPALVRVDYETGYDAERSKKMTGEEVAMLLSIPLPLVLEDGLAADRLSGGTGLPETYSIVIEDPRPIAETDREGRHARVATLMDTLGVVEPGEFSDEKAPAAYRTAEMATYAITYKPTAKARAEGSVPTIDQAWDVYRAETGLPERPDADANAAYLFTGSHMKEDRRLADDLWGISEIGFGQTLGKDHPVSMDESRDFFDNHLLDGEEYKTYTAVRYDEGEPVCFGSMTIAPPATALKACEWLNPEGSAELKRQLDDAAACGENVAFFSEVISNGKTGAAYAMDIFNLFADLTAKLPNGTRLLFESTNRSARYIPRGVKRAVDQSENIEFSSVSQQVEKVALMDYWYLKVQK